MPSLPDQPLIHRSWLTRGHFWPSPWAISPQPLLMDTPVTFSRDGRRESGGSWESTGPVDFYSTQAHVEIEESSLVSDDIQNAAIGFIKRRTYSVIIAMPVDTDDFPKPHDRVRFIDAKGESFNVAIDTVTMPENMPGHLEVASETWE